MEEAKAAKILRASGRRVHLHRGVWWEDLGWGYCKPVHRLRVISPGSAAPKMSGSPLGYSHAVASSRDGNHTWNVMHMGREKLECFSLASISPKRKQQKIKQALKSLEVRLIDRIEPHLDDIAETNIATALRTGHGKSINYYTKQRKRWEGFMLSEFSLPGREWWGAFYENRLIAYYYVYIIERVLHVSAAKSNTEFLHFAPNDAIVFTLLSRHAADRDCDQVVYGDWSPEAQSLNAFKERFGFELKKIPIFRHGRGILRMVMGIRDAIVHFRKCSRREGAITTVVGVESDPPAAENRLPAMQVSTVRG